MGGCASKPRDLKEESEAPLPLDEPTTVSDLISREVLDDRATAGGQGEQGPSEENHRNSLGVLLKEVEAKEAEEPKVEAAAVAAEKTEGGVVEESSNGVVEEAADAKLPVSAAVEVA